VQPDVELVAEVGAQSVVDAGGHRSWYRDEQGSNFPLWPTHTSTFLRRMRRFDAASYRLRTARRAAVPA
jgi:hypothetical protein